MGICTDPYKHQFNQMINFTSPEKEGTIRADKGCERGFKNNRYSRLSHRINTPTCTQISRRSQTNVIRFISTFVCVNFFMVQV